jgi:hypothetical protein
MSTAPPPEDFYIMKYESGMLIDNSAEAIEADPKRKRATINSVKEDFINHDLLPGKIAVKYNLPLPIANEVADHVIADRRSVIDHEPIIDTVFIYRKKEE